MAKTALTASRGTVFLLDPDDVEIVGLDTDDPPSHPLRDDERNALPVTESFVQSILKRGVLLPVIVRKNGSDAVQVVAGRQRIKGAREANRRLREQGIPDDKLIRVRALVTSGDDLDLFGRMVTENEHRTGDSLLGKAKKARRYIDLGGTEAEAGGEFGVSAETIKDWLKLLDLDPAVVQYVQDGDLSPSAAVHLSTLPASKQREAALEATTEGRPTVAKVRRTIRNVKAGRRPDDGPAPPSKTTLRRLVEAAAGNKVELAPEDAAILAWVVTGNVDNVPGIARALAALEAVNTPTPRRRKGGEPPGTPEEDPVAPKRRRGPKAEAPEPAQDVEEF